MGTGLILADQAGRLHRVDIVTGHAVDIPYPASDGPPRNLSW
jgi:hypothetical protein